MWSEYKSSLYHDNEVVETRLFVYGIMYNSKTLTNLEPNHTLWLVRHLDQSISETKQLI